MNNSHSMARQSSSVIAQRLAALLSAAVLLSALAACGGGKPADGKTQTEAKEGAKAEGGNEAGGLKLSAEEAQRAGLKVETLALQAFADTITVTATVRPNQDGIACVAPRGEGRMRTLR